MLLKLLVAKSLATFVLASGEISHCCRALEEIGLGNRLVVSSNAETYTAILEKYFSKTARLKPECFFKPRDTEEVSAAVQALVKANETSACPFAIRSGGHTSFAGAAGIEDGVTIDLGDIRDITYHESNETLSVGAGAVWGEVYEFVDREGIMVTGGRSSSVGVGGLTLGGGNSFYAARKGWVCDNVAQFEVVLGDGRVVIARKDQHQDLFRALKGGSNNFGIVTRFDLQTFKGGKIFGGNVLYPEVTAEQQFEALSNFGDNVEQDPYASVIVISVFYSETKAPMFMNAYEYTKPVEHLEAPIFKEFLAIQGSLSDTTGLRNMTSLTKEFEVPKDSRVSFSTLTFKNDVRVLKKAHELFKQATEKLVAEATGDYGLLTLYQPIPTLFAKHSREKGGNVLGLERFKDNLILYEPYFRWQGEEQDELFESQAVFLREEISKYTKSIGADNPYLYLNYADKDQKPLQSYGEENLELLRAVAKRYDPQEVFQYVIPGGFKIPPVRTHDQRTTESEQC